MELSRTKNVATYIVFPIKKTDGTNISGASGLDSEIDAWEDGSAPDGFSDCTNEATEIGSTGIYYLSLTQAEMNHDYIVIHIKSSSSGAIPQIIIINTKERADIAGIKAKTDNLPADPADDSDIDSQLATIAGYLDTEVAAIKAKTDLIPASPAAVGSAMTLTAAYDAAKTAAAAGAKMDLVDAPSATGLGVLASAVWDKLLTGIITADSIGKLLKDNINATIGSRSSHSAADVWSSVTRSLTDKAGFSLSVTPPTAQNIWEYANRALTDKTGFSLSQAFPTNFSSMAISALGKLTIGTNDDKTGYTASVSDKTGFSLSTAGILAIWHQLVSEIVTASTIGKLIKDNLDAKVSEVGGGSLTAESIRIEMDTNSKLANLPADPADESSLEAAITAAHATTDALISAITGGGLTEKTYTLTDASTGLPLVGVQIWATTDEAGHNQVDLTRTTNDAGQVTFRFNLAAGTPIYIWNRYMAEGDAPDEEEV